MKLTNGKAYLAFFILDQLCQETKFPTKGGFLLARNLKRLRKVATDFEEYRNKIWEENGAVKDDQGFKIEDNQIVFETKEGRKKAREAVRELNEVEIDVNISLIDPDSLGDVEIFPSYLEALDFLFTTEDE